MLPIASSSHISPPGSQSLPAAPAREGAAARQWPASWGQQAVTDDLSSKKHTAPAEGDALYGPDARLGPYAARTRPAAPFALSSSDQQAQTAAETPDSEESQSEQRMLAKLKARDQQVRSKAESQGDSTSGQPYIYQTGPDGKQYAIGTPPHLVRKDDDTPAAASAGTAPASFATQSGGDAENTETLRKLQARDQEVRAHEREHLMAAGTLATGGPTYEYQTGPDGKQYAIGGSVSMSVTSTPGDEESTRRNAAAAERAAMAPGTPSGQDMLVARDAAYKAAAALG